MAVELAELVKVEVTKTSIANISPSAPRTCEGIGKALVPVDNSHNAGKDVVRPLSESTLRIFDIGHVVARRVGVESTVNAHVRYSRSLRVKYSPVPPLRCFHQAVINVRLGTILSTYLVQYYNVICLIVTCSPSYSRHAHRRILLFFEVR